MILTNSNGLESGNILSQYEGPPIHSFREEVKNGAVDARNKHVPCYMEQRHNKYSKYTFYKD